MRGHLVASLVCVAACGGDRGASGVSPQASHPTQPQPQTPIDAGTVDAEPAVALPKRTCPAAHAAAIGACKDGLRCVLIFEISDACIVKVANEIELPDGTSESDGAGVEDLVWPTRDGALYVVNRTETWSWAAVPSPLTAPRDAFARATWTPQKVGETEPEGYQYGLVSDGAKAILVGCEAWGDDCGPDAEECEEWSCEKHVFVDPHTRKTIARQPSLAYVRGPKTGAITPAVTLGTKGKGKRKQMTCTAGTKPTETWYDNPLDGSVALSDTDWIALRYQHGSRMSAKWDVTAVYVRGCSDATTDIAASVVGPGQLWARSTEAGFELQHGPYGGGALTDATGKVKSFGDELFTFTVE